MILLHGFGSDSYTWNNNIDALATRYMVYALDMWGCGYSSRTPNYGYPLYASQLHEFMNTMELGQAYLVGQSMGGGTAVEFATMHPSRVKGVILVGPAGMPDKVRPAQNILALPGVGELLLGLPTDAIRKMLIKKVFIYEKELTPEYYKGLTWSQKIKGSNEAYLKIVRRKFFHTIGDKYAQYGKLNIPTLIIWGKHDKGIHLTPAIVRLIPHARTLVFDRSAHEPHDEEPEKFNRIGLDFLCECGKA